MAHKIEMAKSGRATCRTCREKIDKDTLRFGEETANAFDPGGPPSKPAGLAVPEASVR